MKRVALLVLILASLTSFMWAIAAQAQAAPRALHVGSKGKRVAALQWLLTGNEPSAFRAIKVRKHKPTGEFGKNTAKQVRSAKWLLGYPKAGINGRAGQTLFAYLLGKKKRPLGYVGVASKRIAYVRAQKRGPPCARRVVAIARHELGVHETYMRGPGNNWSPRINAYQSITHQYYVAWCASFIQWVYYQAGIGTIADRSAGVFYIVNWAQRRGWLRSRPKVGALVAYLSRLGHIGIVERVTKRGFWTVEGNSGNSVREHYHPLGYYRTVFVYPPCIQ